jgi:mono/diheme cytochrome c family protein
MRTVWLLSLPLLGLLGTAGCDKGDYFPPERTLRALFNGWDMWDGPAVSPYKAPAPGVAMPGTPEGAIPVNFDKDPFATAQTAAAKLPAEKRMQLGALAYRRFCYHCHGPNGDSRIIVGESFMPKIPDLRTPEAQAKDPREVYNLLMHGSKNMVPLDDTVTPLEAVLAIGHVKTLAGAPSKPFFDPKSVTPIR